VSNHIPGVASPVDFGASARLSAPTFKLPGSGAGAWPVEIRLQGARLTELDHHTTVGDAPGAAPDITIHAVADLSYPMAHCQVPVVDHVTVDNAGAEARGAVIELDVVGAGGSLGGPRRMHLDLAARKPTTLRDVALVLDPAAMLAVDEPQPGFIRAAGRGKCGSARYQLPKVFKQTTCRDRFAIDYVMKVRRNFMPPLFPTEK
jgi:hypothetical protein